MPQKEYFLYRFTDRFGKRCTTHEKLTAQEAADRLMPDFERVEFSRELRDCPQTPDEFIASRARASRKST